MRYQFWQHKIYRTEWGCSEQLRPGTVKIQEMPMVELQHLLHGDSRIGEVIERSRVLAPGVKVRFPEEIIVESETLSSFMKTPG